METIQRPAIDLKARVEDLNRMILEGQILEAIDKHYALDTGYCSSHHPVSGIQDPASQSAIRHPLSAIKKTNHAPSTWALNSDSSVSRGSRVRPQWMSEVCRTAERGKVSQWKRSDGGSRAMGLASGSPRQIR